MSIDAQRVLHTSVEEMSETSTMEKTTRYCNQLYNLLLVQLEEAHANLTEASAHSPMHGVIAAMRYILEMPVIKDIIMFVPFKTFLSELCKALGKVALVVLPVVADLAPEGFDPEILLSDQTEDGYFSEHQSENVDSLQAESAALQTTATSGQFVTVCCWLCIKEISLTSGTIVSLMPTKMVQDPLLPVKQVFDIGEMLLSAYCGNE